MVGTLPTRYPNAYETTIESLPPVRGVAAIDKGEIRYPEKEDALAWLYIISLTQNTG